MAAPHHPRSPFTPCCTSIATQTDSLPDLFELLYCDDKMVWETSYNGAAEYTPTPKRCSRCLLFVKEADKLAKAPSTTSEFNPLNPMKTASRLANKSQIIQYYQVIIIVAIVTLVVNWIADAL
ncbi:uncharacterized protein Dvir_GJ26786, isoform A [Drosophila virilis]|uniref:Uncharacterized protein, isoform A n=1 Tax=Drosophila virilis TaxID=7244 RepID=A0A0Q9WUN5_DROVI|nr:uncharacterized protein LOC26531556 isoform X2 [Drosophila virilis]KRF84590.1 uncharacterized protein Dvir_GJ26786, isoform A [Drosophila virilis]